MLGDLKEHKPGDISECEKKFHGLQSTASTPITLPWCVHLVNLRTVMCLDK